MLEKIFNELYQKGREVGLFLVTKGDEEYIISIAELMELKNKEIESIKKLNSETYLINKKDEELILALI